MMRRYLNGDVIPDYHTVFILAKILNVSAGWLLFGDQADITGTFDSCNYITIKEDLLRYIVDNSAHLFVANTAKLQQISEFIVCLLKIATKISGDDTTKKILIDVAISSANILQDSGSKSIGGGYGI
jgi:transcriptional regulator with XRE-family HTH domain